MPRKLKTFVTTVGFFELAVAAPSMKAALEAWGADRNAFHHGFAEQTDDTDIVEATMEKPGVVLKRAVGTKGKFKETAKLPSSLPANASAHEPSPKKPRKKGAGKPSAEVVSLADKRAAKEAAAAYEREETNRELQEQKAEEGRQKERKRREVAAREAYALFEKAKRRHDAAMERIDKERTSIDERADKENARWEKEKGKLEAATTKARS
ncbi:MAG: cell envelope biogenesis protein TolA [Rhizomicrobium sp.]